MDNTRVSTTLEVKVDARQVGGLDQTMKRAFNPAKVRELTTGVNLLNRSLAEATRNADRLGRTLASAAATVDGYRKLRAELAGVKDEAGRASQAVDRLRGRSGRVGGGGFGGPGGGGGGGGYGGGGAAGGAGGGADTSALGQAAQVLPYAGHVITGSLIAAGMTYSSHLGYERARMSAQPFLTQSARAANYRRRQLSAGTDGHYVGGMNAAEARETAVAKMSNAFASDVMTTGNGIVDSIFGTNTKAEKQAKASKALERTPWLAEGITKAGMGFASLMGQDLEPQIAMASGATYVKGKRASYSRMFDDAAYGRTAGSFGMGPTDALGEAAGMSRGAGGPVDQREFAAGLGAKALFGLSTESSGSLLGNMRNTGSGMEDADDLASAIGQAVAMNLSASQIGDYLQAQTQFLGRMAAKGQSVDIGGLRSTVGRLANTEGVPARLAGDIAMGFGTKGADMAKNGPGGPLDLRLMQAAGYTGEGGMEEYAAIRMKLQDPGYAASLMPKTMELASAGMEGMGPESKALFTQRMLSGYGVDAGADMARGISRGISADGTGDLGYTADRLAAGGRAVSSGSLVAEAGIEADRIRIGGEMAETMQNLARVTNNMAGTASAFNEQLAGATGGVEAFTAALRSATTFQTDRLKP